MVESEAQQYIRKVDASYKPFPPFAEWVKCSVDAEKWDRHTALVEAHRSLSPEAHLRSRQIVERAAAVDTGAIEGLYDTNYGITFTIATQAASWETALDNKAMSFFESQLHAYEYVLDFATNKAPLAEAWIRELHAQICGNQETYAVQTSVGPQQQPFPKGEYKIHPNHVRQPDGSVHAYAPVDSTPEEMHRLCMEMSSEEFLSAHPVLQASYAHYAFVIIHPFADGNGRVARALASVFTYRSNSVPLLILMENRRDYLESLRAADAGDFQPFVDFILERGLDAIKLFDESVKAASAPSIEESVASLKKLYVTKGGYSHEDVESAGGKYLVAFRAALEERLKEVGAENVFSHGIGFDASSEAPTDRRYRSPMGNQRRIVLTVSTQAPAQASFAITFDLWVPKDCDREDDLKIYSQAPKEVFDARITELLPEPTPALKMRLKIVAERVISSYLNLLLKEAAKRLRD